MKRWNDKSIEKEIRYIMEDLGINYFPSASEIKNATKSSSLVLAICRTGGFRYWQQKLGIKAPKRCKKEE